jgi:hypothetical protein
MLVTFIYNTLFFSPGRTGVDTACYALSLSLEAFHQPFFCVSGIFKIGSHELFALAGLKPQSSDFCLLSS